jgi:hypothetical protein
MSQTHKIKILEGFAMVVCQGQCSQPRHAPLAKNKVADTLNHVAVTFRGNGQDNPKQDAEHNVA